MALSSWDNFSSDGTEVFVKVISSITSFEDSFGPKLSGVSLKAEDQKGFYLVSQWVHYLIDMANISKAERTNILPKTQDGDRLILK